jgi:hypothetical protein
MNGSNAMIVDGTFIQHERYKRETSAVFNDMLNKNNQLTNAASGFAFDF